MAVVEALTDEEKYLVAILQDISGVDIAEFLWKDGDQPDNLFRCWPHQYAWYRNDAKKQIDQCGRAVGKSVGIQMRAYAFPFTNPGQEMLITAPELIHLDPVTKNIEDRLLSTRISTEMLQKRNGKTGFVHRPFEASFVNGAKIIGRIPQKDGKGVKGMHPRWLEMDECFPAGTLVLTRRGQVSIEQVVVGDEVLTHNCRWRSVTQTFDRGIRASVAVRGQGHPGLVCTPEHKFLTEAGWVPAQDLVGLRWTSPRVIPGKMPSDIPKAKTGKSREIDINTLDFAWCLGLWLAEGSLSKSNPDFVHANKVTWSVHRTEADEVVHRLMLSGIHAFVQPVQSTVNCLNVVATSVELAKFLEAHCGRGAKSKQLPTWVYSAPLAYRQAVLSGYVYGDGFADPDQRYSAGRWKVSTASKALAVSIRLLALNLGWHVSLYRIADRKKPSVIRGREVRSGEWYQVVGNAGGQVKFDNEYARARVRNAQEGAAVRMFDLEVEEDHSFVADGIIVHNSQDYPTPGWIELTETLRYGDENSRWRAHGVSRGVHDHYYKLTQQNDWRVHRITAMHRPDWTHEERRAKAELYGSRDHPDYRRNILGAHGDALNPLFVLHRLMACVDTNENSDYNADEYTEIRLTDEYVSDMHMPVTALIDLPGRHKNYQKFWIGMDVGMTNHPTEILVFAEDYRKGGGTPTNDSPQPNVRLKLLSRIHLERISGPNQVRVLELLADFYRPQCVAMDRTGLGLPVYQQCVEGLDANPHAILSRVIRGYNFSEKIPVGFEQPTDNDEWSTYYPEDPLEHAIMANVLEYSSDQLRLLVDKQQLRLPYDRDMLKEFSGQQYFVNRTVTNPYGKKEFNKGKFHTLDAARMAILGYVQHNIEDLLKNQKNIHPDATMVIGLDYDDWGGSEAMFF